MNKSKQVDYFLIILFLFPFNLFSQSSYNLGQPFIKYYGPDEYNASYQNWCINQDKRGVMYFGNSNGILEYDGLSWRLIKTPNNSIVRSLCIDENNIIYVAASSDFGYLKPDSSGDLKFNSLLKFLDKRYLEFGDVWDVVSSSHGVYYKTRDKIFRWSNNKIKVFDSVNSFRLYKVRDKVFVRNKEIGLLEVSGDSLIPIPDGAMFASIGVFDMLPFGNNILVSTSNNGLFLYDGNTFEKFMTEADEYLIENRIYNTCFLKDQNLALATMRGGVVIINNNGDLVRIVNSETGLYSDIVYDVLSDKQGGIWLAMNEGISRIQSYQTFTKISKNNTGNNYLSGMIRFQDVLYGSNSLGAFFLNESSSSFKPIGGINSQVNFVSIDSYLFAASNTSIYRIDGKDRIKKLFDYEAALLYQSPNDSSIIYVLYRIGLAIFKYKNGNLQLIYDSSPIGEEMSSMIEDHHGCIWINTFYKGVVRIRNYNDLIRNEKNKVEITRYNENTGLPGKEFNLFLVNGKVLIATGAGLYSYDFKSETFLPDSTLGNTFIDSTYFIKIIAEDKAGNLWILAKSKEGYELGKASIQNNGKYSWQPNPAFRFLDLNNVFTLYNDFISQNNKEFLWVSSDDGLIRYDTENDKIYDGQFETLIRRVIVSNDSLVFNGNKDDLILNENIFTSENDNILFQFTATSYDKTEANRFQYFLEGNDNGWSNWTYEKTKGYTNLSSGKYKFHVRSKNIYGVVGKEDLFEFSILSPWYFSWWAYFIYGFLFLGLLYQVRRYEIKRLNKKHNLQLELVKYERLKELDQMKSQFFANISHEFRTPLTLILGQIDNVMSSNVDTREKGKLQIADRNARRLLTLINQLLDLSKLEAGSMELNASSHNIVSFLKSLFYSFESLAEAQKITLKFESEYENLPVLFDPDKMEKVFYNLISNALKFTKSGEVKVAVNKIDEERIKIRIKDTGIGMNEEQLKNIFNRFYQADSSSTREHEGTGIGLALTKELVELHKGEIKAISKQEEGTEFIITLPAGDLKTDKEKLFELPSDEFIFENISNGVETSATELESGIRYPESENTNEIILVVEDNTDVRAYIKEQLQVNYKIIEAPNGEEGIKQAQNEIPDLIITDVMMPKMDGYKFSSEIRCNEKTSHIPIIMLTARAGLDDKIEGFETGIDAYLTKPFSAKELKVRVRNLIQQRKELRKRFRKSTVIKPSEVSAISADQKFLENTLKIIEANIEDFKFGIENLAYELNLSVSQLSRKLNALVDQPAGQLIRSMRLQRAADYLKKETGNIAEICYKVGFNDQAYFSRAFKKQFGCSPSEFKNNNLRQDI